LESEEQVAVQAPAAQVYGEQGTRPGGLSPLTGVQVPAEPLMLQASHCPLQAESQQFPSTHWPLRHSFSAAHGLPLPCFAWHTPAEQNWPVAHWASEAQFPRHCVAAQAYTPQLWFRRMGQLPVPVQLAARTAVPLVQLAVRHRVSPLGYAQARASVPLQVPPHIVPSELQARRVPWGAPLTGAQVPTKPATSQAWHCPLQAALQQRPSMQNPLPHWFSAVQVFPFVLLGMQTPLKQ